MRLLGAPPDPGVRGEPAHTVGQRTDGAASTGAAASALRLFTDPTAGSSPILVAE